MMHTYKPEEAQSCFSGRRIVLAGDSMVRETFWALARQIDSPVPTQAQKHLDIHVTVEDIHLDFYWDPYLNGSGFQNAFSLPDGVAKPALTIVGTGLWHAKNVVTNTFQSWQKTIDDIVLSGVIGRHKDNVPSDMIVMLPLSVPDWPRLSPARRSITPEKLLQMNSYLEDLSERNLVNVAFSFNDMLLTAAPEDTHVEDGLHLVDKVTNAQAQLLLNLRCNDNLPKKFPFDNTCCSKYPPPNYQQLLFLVIVLFVIPIVYRFTSLDLLHKSYIPSESVLQALLAFGLVLVYTYFTDRTHFFGKEAKHFSLEQFCVLVVLTGIVGYLTAETADKDQAFLNRDQTDEWKGWMQILILIYHYLGASKVSWIYNGIRVLVAMYLFMTGFGHTVFFYKKADYSFKRVVAVMIRLNLLNVVLAYTMNTDYLFYYFSPLISFWFGVIWITMWIKHDHNKDMRFLGAKFAVSAIVVTIFTKKPGILETLFSVLKTVANINWDAVEWRFRIGLDMWIVYVGMIVAILFIKASDFQSSPNWPNYRSIALRLSIITIPAYFLFEATRESKFIYNHWHPYISVFPILAFIILRNASTRLRNTHSTAFAFIGRCSLETFILQFHIWLAGDTKGVLIVIGPSQWRWVSFIFGTAIFLFLSWKVAAVTGVITGWIMGNQKKQETAPSVAAVALVPLPNEPLSENDESSLPAPVTSVQQLSFSEKLVRVMGLYWEDLRIRTGAITILLWILNLVCSLHTLTNSSYLLNRQLYKFF